MANQRLTLDEMKVFGYKARIAELAGALELALCYLAQYEPNDSRVVSDEYVAMSAIAAGGAIVNDEAREIVKTRLEAFKQNVDKPQSNIFETIALTLEQRADPRRVEAPIWREAAQIVRNRGLVVTRG